MRWREPVPSLVAESLVEPSTPPLPVSRWRAGDLAEVRARILAARAPERSDATPPPWLRPHQHEAFLRAVASVERFGGAMLAEPVGSGKTWIALATARALTTGPVACLVPAVLRAHWERVAARAGITARICSHAQASRGRLPHGGDLLIIDESHHYRNSGIRRYGHVARWLVGRRGILLTATPVVNRVHDLVHQLRLVLRDDCLAPFGVPSLLALAHQPVLPEPITRIVIRSPPSGGGPVRVPQACRAPAHRGLCRILRRVERLRLSPSESVRQLVLGTLWRAAASSPAALHSALRRYCLLLRASHDARASGRDLAPDALRRWAGSDGAQVTLWALIPEPENSGGLRLCVDDDPLLSALLAELASMAPDRDPRARALKALVADGVATLVFCTSRDTVRWIRRALGYQRTAWCTGASAGIGGTRWPRDAVLGLYRDAGMTTPAPRLLICTDVAAEGLDLPRLERVVHYDLPWTPARLEQRVGRAARPGSRATHVAVVEFPLPRIFERRLGMLRVIARKARTADAALTVAEQWGGFSGTAIPTGGLNRERGWPIATAATGPRHGVLAAFEAIGLDGTGQLAMGTSVVWLSGGRRHTDLSTLQSVIDRLATASSVTRQGSPIGGVAHQLVEAERHRLTAALNGRLWRLDGRAAHGGVVRRLRQWRTRAARTRDTRQAELVSNALRLVAGGRTAGEEILLLQLAQGDDPAGLAVLPAVRLVQHFEVRNIAAVEVIGFRPPSLPTPGPRR